MTKRLVLAVALLGVLLLLAGCRVKGNPLPEGMDAAELLAQGREVVGMLNEAAWQDIYDLLREDAKAASSPEAIQAYMEAVLEKAGASSSERDAITTGQKLEDTGEEYGTAVFYWKHEKKKVLYRVAFSLDMELMGIEVKVQ